MIGHQHTEAVLIGPLLQMPGVDSVTPFRNQHAGQVQRRTGLGRSLRVPRLCDLGTDRQRTGILPRGHEAWLGTARRYVLFLAGMQVLLGVGPWLTTWREHCRGNLDFS